MIENKQIEKKNSWFTNIRISEAATIAIIPIVSQIIVFVFQIGYFGVFKIPVTLISFSLNDLFIVMTSILSIVAIVHYFSNQIFLLVKSTAEPIRDKLLRCFGGIIYLFVLFFSYGPKLWREWLLALFGVILLLIFEFIFPILQFRGKGSYREKLIAHTEQRVNSEQNSEIKTPVDTLLQLFGPRIILFLLALYGIYHFGRAAAMSQMDFRVASTTPETVVLWMGDDRFIVAPFDKASKMIEPSFQILLVGEDPTIIYRLQKVGPLSLNEKAIVSTQSATVISTESFVNTTLPPVSTSTPMPEPSLVATRTRIPTENDHLLTSPTINLALAP